MGHKLLRSVLALLTFAVTVQWSRVAQAAPLTLTGTVGEIGVIDITFLNGVNMVRFKFTNANTTAACPEYVYNNNANLPFGVAGYAYFFTLGQPVGNSDAGKEWYAELLYSKKGAPMSCIVTNDYTGCHVTSCSLP